MKNNIEIATFANGCFWCTEAIFKRLKGVISVTPGYTGGITINPSYEEACTGNTGHAEAIQIEYDSKTISYETLLNIFWLTHDPTTPNRQGNDIGTQYRSAVFYHNNVQKKFALMIKSKLEKAKIFINPIVTEISKLDKFYIAENYHKNYFDRNKDSNYCRIIINPKIIKFLSKYKNLIKEEYLN